MSLRSSAGGPVGLIASGLVIALVGAALAAASWPGETDGFGGTVETGDGLVAFIGAAVAAIGSLIAAIGTVFAGVYLGVSRALEERDGSRL